MKEIKLVFGSFRIMGCLFMFWANSAFAQLNMTEKENTQTIVWIVEAVTFITTLSIVAFVWKISKRSKNSRNNNQVSGLSKNLEPPHK